MSALMGGAVLAAAPPAGAALGGLYLAFDLAVLPALGRQATRTVPAGSGPDGDAVAADLMRRINVDIVRPSFMALLVGAPVLAVGAAITSPTPLTLAAAALQVAGLVVTIAVNVPRNATLARDHAPGAWGRFVGPWRRAHRVRTAAALLAVGAGVGAVITG